jgi:acetyl esterase/lipase
MLFQSKGINEFDKLVSKALVALLLLFSYTDVMASNEISAVPNGAGVVPIEYPSAAKNTPYGQVAKLAYTEPSSIYRYADEHPDQYAAFWPARNLGPNEHSKGVVVFIHGGCWLSAYDMSHSYAFATGLSQAGFHVWSIEYRRTGNGGEWPLALEDIKLGLQKLSVLKESGIQLEHINIVGHSAGGHLAAMLAIQLEDVLPTDVKKADIIGLAAITNLVEYANGDNSCQTATPSFMRGMPKEQTLAYYLASPSNFSAISDSLASFKLLQGTADAIVPVSQASHKSAVTIKIEGAGHFDWIHPGSDAFKQLIENLSR